MKGLLLQYDDRSPLWAQKLIERNKKAAEILNYEHIYLQTSEFDDTVPPYWRKVFLVHKFLKTNNYDYVAWIDSDAVMINEIEFLKLVDTELVGEKSFAFASNPGLLRSEWWPFKLWTAPFCAGTFIVKNCDASLEILETWMASYNPSLWKKVDSKWKAEGIYGGPSYEQGCFELFIFRDVRFAKNLLQTKHTRMNYLPLKKESCSAHTIFLHYWNGNRARIWKDWGGDLHIEDKQRF